MSFSGAGTLAFAIRSGVNLILLLARIQRVRKMPRFVQGCPATLICRTDCLGSGRRVFRLYNTRSLGQTLSVSVPCSVRQMFLTISAVGVAYIEFLGSFVLLYRILLNAFPLLFPTNVPGRLNLRRLTGTLLSQRDGSAIVEAGQYAVESDPLLDSPPVRSRRARLSSTAQAHQTWLRQRSARWHSVVAGAVAGGVAISFERLSRQKVIAQQLFVRQVIRHASRSWILNTVCVHDTAVFKVPTMPIQRSAVSAFRMGTSSFLPSRESSS